MKIGGEDLMIFIYWSHTEFLLQDLFVLGDLITRQGHLVLSMLDYTWLQAGWARMVQKYLKNNQ